MEQVLPQALEAERAVLGVCLADEEAINDALEFLVAEDFSLDSHQKIFRSISEMCETGNKVDLITMMEDLKRRKELDAVGGVGYLSSLQEDVPRGMNIAGHCRIIKDKAVLRSMMVLFDASSARAADQSEPTATILGDVEERILELSQQQASQKFTTILDAVEESGSVDSYVEKMCDPAEMTGLATEFIDVDKVWGGMREAELIVIAARPGQGKTSIALDIAKNVALKDTNKVVGIFSLEMSKASLFARMLASEAGVSIKRADEGFVSEDEKFRMRTAVLNLGGAQIHIDDTAGISTLQIRAKSRRLKQKMGRLDLIVIDYLQLVTGSGKHGNRQEEVGSVSRGLKALSKELMVPVIALAQLSRKNEERGDKRPMLSDLRESGSIEQDADIVAFIHREEYYRSADDPDVERGVAEIITSKNRNGATGMRKLAFQAALTRFSNLTIRESGAY